MKILKQNGLGIQKLYDRHTSIRKRTVSEKVRRIIDDVQLHGDELVDSSEHLVSGKHVSLHLAAIHAGPG